MEKPIITVIYSHGKNGSAWHGTKIKVLRPIVLKMGMNIISIDYSDNLSIEQMEEKLFDTVRNTENVPGDSIFLSSSRGGYISTNSSLKISELFANEPIRVIKNKTISKRNLLGQFLIAPALYCKPFDYPNQNPKLPSDTLNCIVHGYDDNVIDYKNSLKFAEKYKTDLHLMKGDHRMNNQIDKISRLFEVFLNDCQIHSDKLFIKFIKKEDSDDI